VHIDLTMWAKNGAEFLPLVLKRIDEIIPQEMRGRKIFVDDHSTDDSRKIAREFNWEVYENKEGGIGNGANIALGKVNSEIFASFEQDVLLAKNWLDKILPLIERPKVAVAQGWRLSTNRTLLDLEIGVPWVKYPLYSIDNNIYRTSVIRSVGGFPTYVSYCVDGVLRSLVIRSGWKWITDTSTISVHLRSMSLLRYALTAERRGRDFAMASEIFLEEERRKMGFRNLVRSFICSPIAATGLCFAKKNPFLVWYYPMVKFFTLKGYIEANHRR